MRRPDAAFARCFSETHIFVEKNLLTTGRKEDILNKLLRQGAAAGRIAGSLEKNFKKVLDKPGRVW